MKKVGFGFIRWRVIDRDVSEFWVLRLLIVRRVFGLIIPRLLMFSYVGVVGSRGGASWSWFPRFEREVLVVVFPGSKEGFIGFELVLVSVLLFVFQSVKVYYLHLVLVPVSLDHDKYT